MKKHMQYLKYIIIHKWFVLVAGLKIGAPIWRLIVHDLSKFKPSEWQPYANYFYGGPFKKFSGFVQPMGDDCTPYYNSSKEGVDEAFDKAWLLHQHRNPHHWQYWILREDSGAVKYLEMPHCYVLEMVADWLGAGRAITGKWEADDWYEKNKEKILLGPLTRRCVEAELLVAADF